LVIKGRDSKNWKAPRNERKLQLFEHIEQTDTERLRLYMQR